MCIYMYYELFLPRNGEKAQRTVNSYKSCSCLHNKNIMFFCLKAALPACSFVFMYTTLQHIYNFTLD